MSPIELSQREAITREDDWHLYTTSSGSVVDIALPRVLATEIAEYQILHTPGRFDDLNGLVAEARRTVDEAQRHEITKQAIDLLDDLVMTLVLFTINRNTASKPSLSFQETPRFGIELRPGRFAVTG